MSTKNITDLPPQKPLDNHFLIDKLRECTGMGIEVCKEALQHCNGDLFKASEYVKAKTPKF